MADINIYNLNSIGSSLFADPESYLQDLSELKLHVQGGADDGTQPVLTITTLKPTLP